MDFPISVPSIGLVGGKFVDEDPLTGTPGSLIPSQWGNAVTEEVLNAIVAAGLTPDESNNAQLVAAIRLLQKQPVLVVDTGVANVYTAVNTPSLSVLPEKGYVQRIIISHANTGASTYAPDGLSAKPIYGLALQPLQGGELPVGIAVLMYLVQAGVNGGNGAWILIESLGGAQQVPPATKSQHAMQLGQAIGRFIGVQQFTSSGTYTPTAGATKMRIRCLGGGGGGGGTAATSAGQAASGGGGAAGGYAEGYFDVTGPVAVTIGAAGSIATGGAGGAGGATSVGALISSPGGSGGLLGPATSTFPSFGSNGGLPGALPTGGNIVASRGPEGGYGLIINSTATTSGAGSDSPYGGGGWHVSNAGGTNATGRGAGGSGASANAGSPAVAGGSGGLGLVIIEEFS